MKGKDVRCPICGTVNRSLFLEETEGNYECECCGYCGTEPGYGRIMIRIIAGKENCAGKSVQEERLTPLMV